MESYYVLLESVISHIFCLFHVLPDILNRNCDRFMNLKRNPYTDIRQDRIP